jgi:hypothetical protein
MQHHVGVLHGASYVVGNHDDGDARLAVDLGYLAVQLLRDHRVQPGNRFIQKQQLSRGAERPGQQHALLLASGQFPVTLVAERPNAKALQVFPDGGFVRSGVEGQKAAPAQPPGQDDFMHAGGKVLLYGGLLRQIADFVGFQALRNASRMRLFQAQKALDQRALAGAVFSDDAQIIAAVHRKIQSADHGLPFVGERDVPAGNQCHISLVPPLVPPRLPASAPDSLRRFQSRAWKCCDRREGFVF